MTRKYNGGSMFDDPAVMPFNVYRTQQILDEDNKYRKGEYDLAQRQIKSWAFDPTQTPERTLQLTEQQQYTLSIYVNRFINEIDRYLDHFYKTEGRDYKVDVSPVSVVIRWNDLANYFSVNAGRSYTDIVINTLLQNDIINKMTEVVNSIYNPENDEEQLMRKTNDILEPLLKITTNINSSIIEPVSIPLVDYNVDSNRFFSRDAPEEGGQPPRGSYYRPESGQPPDFPDEFGAPPKKPRGRPPRKLTKKAEQIVEERKQRGRPPKEVSKESIDKVLSEEPLKETQKPYFDDIEKRLGRKMTKPEKEKAKEYFDKRIAEEEKTQRKRAIEYSGEKMKTKMEAEAGPRVETAMKEAERLMGETKIGKRKSGNGKIKIGNKYKVF